jgi:hypothetical protein
VLLYIKQGDLDMGLGISIYSTSDTIDKPFGFRRPMHTSFLKEYGRHYALRDLFMTLYVSKGGDRREFNSTYMILTIEDLDCMEQSLRFSAYDGGSHPYLKHDLEWIGEAKKRIVEGNTVICYCNW